MQDHTITIRLLGPEQARVLDRVAEDVFDGPVSAERARAFLASGNHLIAVAIAEGEVVAMATGVVFLHPDKPPQLWVMEVGTAGPWQRRGLAAGCVKALVAAGRARGCTEAWVATEDDNAPARALYRSLGAEETENIVACTWDLDG